MARNNCPRHPVLDDALADGLVRVVGGVTMLMNRRRQLL